MLTIREANTDDHDGVWEIFSCVASAGDTYPHSPAITRDEAIRYWFDTPTATYVAELDGRVVGAYYLRPNQVSLGSHVCNCGYIVAEHARGKGVATQLCKHSQQAAVELGFRAMQFNLVVATNEVATRLYTKLGFDIVGTLPRAFKHRELGLVDACVMYKWLA